MIGNVIEESWLVEIRTSSEHVEPPFASSSLQLCPVEALSYVRAFANGNQPPRSVIELLPAGLQDQPIIAARCTDLDECCFEIQLLFVDRPGPPCGTIPIHS